MRNSARANKFNGKLMRIMRNAVRKVTALLRVNCAVPELTVTLNHYHGLIRRSNINTTTMRAGPNRFVQFRYETEFHSWDCGTEAAASALALSQRAVAAVSAASRTAILSTR